MKSDLDLQVNFSQYCDYNRDGLERIDDSGKHNWEVSAIFSTRYFRRTFWAAVVNGLVILVKKV